MRELTFICAYYLNQGMYREQLAVWNAYPAELRQRFHAIVTDDLSPHSPARDVFEPIPIASHRLYRAEVHRRWDWLFARNLGVSVARTGWVLLTDIDHVLPEDTLRTLLTASELTGVRELTNSPKGPVEPVRMPLDPEYIYRFRRVDAHGRFPWPHGSLTAYKEHPNSWLMTPAMFEQMGGYDERFSGFYGSDSDFRERCKLQPENAATMPAKGVILLDCPLVRYPREVIPDASTTTYQRKESADGVAVPRIRAERALIRGWRPLRLTIPHVLEASC